VSTNVYVVSPHLDDAVFSLGATVAALTARGARVRAVTLFAGDPECDLPAGESNRRAGFATVGEASRTRRQEDARACGLLGMTPRWLRFNDDEAFSRDRDVLAAALATALADADLVLVPGSPLQHPDHRLTTDLVLALPDLRGRVGLYVEQPYTAWRLLRPGAVRRAPHSLLTGPQPVEVPGTGVRWSRSPATVSCYRRKLRALGAYRSQLPVLHRLPRTRVALYELAARGEHLTWPRGFGADGVGDAHRWSRLLRPHAL
jgi:LmbE family N-acetylglucosaminyl deacetylase